MLCSIKNINYFCTKNILAVKTIKQRGVKLDLHDLYI